MYQWKYYWTFLLCVLIFILNCKLVHGSNQFRGYWLTGEWNKCSGKNCGPDGLQIRGVTCQDSQLNIQIPHSHCNQSAKPNDQQNCFQVCEKHSDEYDWDIGPWKVCNINNSLAFNNRKCENVLRGKQKRSVKCVHTANNSVLADKAICAHFEQQPTVERQCIVPCPVDCITSSFGAWSKCSPSCGNAVQIRVRSILLPPKHGGASCPKMYETRACGESRSCSLLPENILQLSPWSSCKKINRKLLPRSSRSKEKQRKHLIGVRTKSLTCYSQNGKELKKGFSISEMCIRTIDCSVSHWLNWSDCTASCGNNGTQVRSRSIEKIPQGFAARACPDLVQTRSCSVETEVCPRHMWLAGSWSDCDLIYNSSCGGGLQSRDVYCVRIGGLVSEQVLKSYFTSNDPAFSSLIHPVQLTYCKSIPKPQQWRTCDVSCQHKCDVGAWSRWSNCALASCVGDPGSQQNFRRHSKRPRGFKRRVRVIQNAYGSPEDCPHLMEFIPCVNARCFTWHVTSSSLCLPRQGICGNGTITRHVECRNLWGVVVEDRFCSLQPRPKAISRLSHCYVPCSEDCVLSEWSPWSPCPLTCQGRKGPGIRNRTRYIVAFPSPRGVACPGKDALTEGQACNQHKCPVYYWNALRWAPCMRYNNYSDKNGSTLRNNWTIKGSVIESQSSPQSDACQVGHQSRRVVCKKKRSGRVGDKSCISWNKPAKSRTCKLPCNRDCVLSEWGAWSSCSDQCLLVTGNNNPTNPVPVNQQRRKYVIQHRSGSGTPCLRETEQKQECESEHQCRKHQWRVGEWGACLLTVDIRWFEQESRMCRGVMTRDVFCVLYLADGGQHRSNSEECFKSVGVPPHAARPCQTDCPRDVAFRAWKRKSSCSVPANLLSTSKLNLTSEFESSPTPTKPAARPIGSWSSCVKDAVVLQDPDSDCLAPEEIIRDPLASIPRHVKCETGNRKRALGCFEEDTGLMFKISYCNYDAFEWEKCEIPCPVDCKMSDWNRWGKCGNLSEGKPYSSSSNLPISCGENVKLRFRYLITLSSSGGRACPPLDQFSQDYQSQLCHNNCDSFFWSAENNWETCSVTQENNSSNCGQGVTVQSPVCYRRLEQSGFDNSASVAHQQCDISLMPWGSRVCRLPCIDQCVLSDWSSWQPCSGSSLACRNSTRNRTRRVLRHPESNPSFCEQNNKLVEEQSCQINTNCFTYKAQWSLWTGCLLPGDARCGSGYRKRKSNCVRSDGVVVARSKCDSNNVDLPGTDVVPCRVACPVDCLLSDWSSWSSCSASCGSRVRTRSRKVLREASSLGRACKELNQTKPCCWKPCYSWKLFGWAGCVLPRGVCGVGVEERVVACVQEDSSRVDSRLCRHQGGNDVFDQFPIFELSRLCHVTCPWTCRESDWSSWSACQGTCYEPGKTRNETRTRFKYFFNQVGLEKCKSPVIETSQCPVITCPNNDTQLAKNKPIILKETKSLVPLTTPITSTPVSVFPQTQLDTTHAGTWFTLNPINEDGSLKIWAYGAIAGLVVLLVFIIAVTYLLCSACHRTEKKRKHRHRPAKNSGSNAGVGLVVHGTGGSSAYGTGGNGYPPYFVSPQRTGNYSPDFRRSSSRSVRRMTDDYDDI